MCGGWSGGTARVGRQLLLPSYPASLTHPLNANIPSFGHKLSPGHDWTALQWKGVKWKLAGRGTCQEANLAGVVTTGMQVMLDW